MSVNPAASSTPRPRPPAARRSISALKSSPPPSYASSFLNSEGRSRASDTLLGSPVRATIEMMGWDERAVAAMADPGSPALNPDDFDWLNERSKGELSDLLVKADNIIKRRETGMCVLVLFNVHQHFPCNLLLCSRSRPFFCYLQDLVRGERVFEVQA